MTMHGRYHAKHAPLLLGVTVPAHWALDEAEVRSDGSGAVLVQRAEVLGFDFLLTPHAASAGSTLSGRAIRAVPNQAWFGGELPITVETDNQRDLIWLQRPSMAAQGGVVVSAPAGVLDRKRALFLRERIAAVRAAGEGGQDRCVLLEIGVEGIGLGNAASGWDSLPGDEDDVLESFVLSLGRTLPKTGTGTGAIDREKLHEFLLLLRETGCDGASLVLPDPLRDMEFFGDYAMRRGAAA